MQRSLWSGLFTGRLAFTLFIAAMTVIESVALSTLFIKRAMDWSPEWLAAAAVLVPILLAVIVIHVHRDRLRNVDVTRLMSSFEMRYKAAFLPQETENFRGMIARASEVLGSRDEAMRWLGTPIPALGLATPISILGTKEGVQRINDVLTQMEHGVW